MLDLYNGKVLWVVARASLCGSHGFLGGHLQVQVNRSHCQVSKLKRHDLRNESTCPGRLKFANDSEENWVKVLWSDETKIHPFASTQLAVFGGGGMHTIPTVKHGGGNIALGVFFC